MTWPEVANDLVIVIFFTLYLILGALFEEK